MKYLGNSCQVFFLHLAMHRLFRQFASEQHPRFPVLLIGELRGLVDDLGATLKAWFRFVQMAPKPVAELVVQERKEGLHFMGNASLFRFDDTTRCSLHELRPTEARMVHLLSDRYDWRNIYFGHQP